MALTWDSKSHKDRSGKIISKGYEAQLPYWGEAVVYTNTQQPGQVFLDCVGLGIEIHPLGKVAMLDALNPAETVLLKELKQHAEWCLEAMVAIGTPGGR